MSNIEDKQKELNEIMTKFKKDVLTFCRSQEEKERAMKSTKKGCYFVKYISNWPGNIKFVVMMNEIYKEFHVIERHSYGNVKARISVYLDRGEVHCFGFTMIDHSFNHLTYSEVADEIFKFLDTLPKFDTKI